MSKKTFKILCSTIVFIYTYEAPFTCRNSTGTSLYIWSDWIQHKKTELVWSLIFSGWNNRNTNNSWAASRTEVQTKVQNYEIRSPVVGLTVPLPNLFSRMGRKCPLTNINQVIQERQVYQVTARNNSQYQPANPLKCSLIRQNSSLMDVFFQILWLKKNGFRA